MLLSQYCNRTNFFPRCRCFGASTGGGHRSANGHGGGPRGARAGVPPGRLRPPRFAPGSVKGGHGVRPDATACAPDGVLSSPTAPPAGLLAGRLQHTIDVPSCHEVYRQFVDVYLVELDKEVAPLGPVGGGGGGGRRFGMPSTQTFMLNALFHGVQRAPLPSAPGHDQVYWWHNRSIFVSSRSKHSNFRS